MGISAKKSHLLSQITTLISITKTRNLLCRIITFTPYPFRRYCKHLDHLPNDFSHFLTLSYDKFCFEKGDFFTWQMRQILLTEKWNRRGAFYMPIIRTLIESSTSHDHDKAWIKYTPKYDDSFMNVYCVAAPRTVRLSFSVKRNTPPTNLVLAWLLKTPLPRLKVSNPKRRGSLLFLYTWWRLYEMRPE